MSILRDFQLVEWSRPAGAYLPTVENSQPVSQGRSRVWQGGVGAVVLGLLCQTGWGVDFNRGIRPILSEHCFACHGFDEAGRKAGLRLDTREGALSVADSGAAAVVPGRPDQSVLARRIESPDADELMPPPKHGRPLSPAQIALLRGWIEEGAPYARHWAFEPPAVTAASPTWTNKKWHNKIDAFVAGKLEGAGLTLAEEAEREVLLRRVTLDLTGLAPSLAEVDAFLADGEPGAYERVVEHLLHSPRFGERMAVDWLDAARYADTNGYFGDKTRSAWPWREWVIRAFNANMPFDRFTVEQLAGDLLTSPTREQLIATGFLRNSMANNESGIIDEEYRVEAIVDRIDTTATTWLGLTIGCAQCHDHKFDPISQQDYYRLFAFFNNSPETGLIKDEDPPPVIEIPSTAQEAALRQARAEAKAALAAWAPLEGTLRGQMEAWESTAVADLKHPLRTDEASLIWSFDERAGEAGFAEAGPGSLEAVRGVLGNAGMFDATKHLEGPSDLPIDSDRPWALGFWLESNGSLSGILAKCEPEGDRRGLEVIWRKGRILINLVHRWGVDAIEVASSDPLPAKTWLHLIISYDGSKTAAGVRLLANGAPLSLQVSRDSLTGSISNCAPLLLGRRDSGLGLYGSLDEFWLLPRTVSVEEAANWRDSERVRGILARTGKARSPADAKQLRDYYVPRYGGPEMESAYAQVRRTQEREQALSQSTPTALVMRELPQPRKTHVLTRGVYDQPGVRVYPGVPGALGELPELFPDTRLGLARWLVSPRNPLTARVMVNRLWQQCFGEGLVRTPNDFGSQGEAPTHPELLDWLALEFMRGGWDVKSLLRRIVTSATYRQSSKATPEMLRRDPENRLLARGPRFRLSAEMLRDQALAVSGLLVNELGGHSVKPSQPPGLWEAVSYNGDESYVPDTGAGLWRRTLYSFWKRQAPPQAALTFDGPTREKCVVKRARTNTPLQALLLLNDETYVAAAVGLARRAMAGEAGDEARIAQLFRMVTARRPDAHAVSTLAALLAAQRREFAGDPSAAATLAGLNSTSAVERAAWIVLAHTLLNLDDVITRR